MMSRALSDCDQGGQRLRQAPMQQSHWAPSGRELCDRTLASHCAMRSTFDIQDALARPPKLPARESSLPALLAPLTLRLPMRHACLLSLAILLLSASAWARQLPTPEGAAAPAPSPPAAAPTVDELRREVARPFRLTPTTSLTLLVSLLVSALSNAAGVGGGAVFVPLFNVALGFPLKLATALSQAVITGGALGSVAYSTSRRHPLAPSRPLIDLDAALALAPPLLLGVGCGVLLNIALPSWLITFLLIPLLLFLTYRTALSGLRMRRAERRQAVAAGSSGPEQRSERKDGQLAGQSQQQQQQREQQQGERKLGGPALRLSSEGEAAGGWHIPAVPIAETPDWQLGLPAGEPACGSLELAPRHAATPPAASLAEEAGEDAGSRAAAAEAAEEGPGSPAVTLRRWLSSPGLLDGVLEPGTCRSSPVPDWCWDRGPDGWQADGQAGISSRDSRRGSTQGWEVQDGGLGAATMQQQQQQQQPEPGQEGLGRLGSKQWSRAEQQQQESAVPFPWFKLGEMLILWSVVFAFQVGKEQFTRCSWQYGALFGGQAAAILAFSGLFSWQTSRGQAGSRPASEEQPILTAGAPRSSDSCTAQGGCSGQGAAAAAEGSAAGAPALPAWTGCKLAVASAVCLAGGVVAGTLGIGGGMVIAPLLLEFGVHPQAASATSGLLVLFSASSAVLSFAAAGRLNLQYAAAFGCACLAAAFAGTFLIGRAVRRSGRASLVVLLLAGIIGLGAVCTLAFAGRRAVEELVHGERSGGGPFCNG